MILNCCIKREASLLYDGQKLVEGYIWYIFKEGFFLPGACMRRAF